jgi:predicted double-glycine peptidase
MFENFFEIQKEYRSFLWSLSFLLLFLSWLVSCVGISPPENRQVSHMIRNVPFYPQEKYQCGPASLAGVLNHWKINVSPEEIASEIYSKSARGTLNIDMALYVEKIGLKVRQYGGSFEDIRDKIDSGYPLIVLVDEGFLIYQKNHFMVVIGYGGEGIIVNSGREQGKFIPVRKFFRPWERTKFWTLVITPN